MKSQKTNKKAEIEAAEVAASVAQVNKDAMVALLIVSLTINMFVLVGWVTLQVTSGYDAQVAAFLFNR